MHRDPPFPVVVRAEQGVRGRPGTHGPRILPRDRAGHGRGIRLGVHKTWAALRLTKALVHLSRGICGSDPRKRGPSSSRPFLRIVGGVRGARLFLLTFVLVAGALALPLAASPAAAWSNVSVYMGSLDNPVALAFAPD